MEKETINKYITQATGISLDFYSDLNACHEMENGLTDEQWDDYRIRLEGLDWRHVNATAAQRCEAFLRCLNLWDDTK